MIYLTEKGEKNELFFIHASMCAGNFNLVVDDDRM